MFETNKNFDLRKSLSSILYATIFENKQFRCPHHSQMRPMLWSFYRGKQINFQSQLIK